MKSWSQKRARSQKRPQRPSCFGLEGSETPCAVRNVVLLVTMVDMENATGEFASRTRRRGSRRGVRKCAQRRARKLVESRESRRIPNYNLAFSGCGRGCVDLHRGHRDRDYLLLPALTPARSSVWLEKGTMQAKESHSPSAIYTSPVAWVRIKTFIIRWVD